MVEADFSGDYVNVENTQQGDIMEIVSEAKYEEFTKKDGSVKTILNIPVLVNGKNKIYSPSRDAGRALVKAFGKETKEWIGHKLQAEILNYKSFGITKQMIECKPLL
jgi:hypothetical protein